MAKTKAPIYSNPIFISISLSPSLEMALRRLGREILPEKGWRCGRHVLAFRRKREIFARHYARDEQVLYPIHELLGPGGPSSPKSSGWRTLSMILKRCIAAPL